MRLWPNPVPAAGRTNDSRFAIQTELHPAFGGHWHEAGL
jgi:hypothetical protein